MGIVTDKSTVEDKKDPDTSNLFALYRLFATEAEIAAMAERYRAGGLGYGEVKKTLLAKIDAYFAPARERRKELASRPDFVEDVLRDGAKRARIEAQKTMDLVRRATGLR
jgi:tryptophanyl-tRNA synthetase